MILLDTNYILRFLLKDDEKLFQKSKEVITSNSCFIDNEVFAEVVFVLQKVYKIPRAEIRTTLERFISSENIILNSKNTMTNALKIFDENNLDFVDAILCAKSKEYLVKTFNKN